MKSGICEYCGKPIFSLSFKNYKRKYCNNLCYHKVCGKNINLDYIKNAYIEQEKGVDDIAKELGVDGKTIWKKLRKMGVKIRTANTITKRSTEKRRLAHLGQKGIWKGKKRLDIVGVNNPSKRQEVKDKISKALKGRDCYWLKGDKNNFWAGGKSFEPYTSEFNEKFKELIRIRDGFLCLKCGMKQEDSLILLKRKLAVHHVDYIKENTILENCCALCQRCNIDVNTNRLHWNKFFQSLLAERYGYQYSENGEIILKCL